MVRPEADPRPAPRVFFALWPPLPVAQALHEKATTLQAQLAGRVMAMETLHQTLVFLGNIRDDRLEALKSVGAHLNLVPGFTLNLDRLGYWPHNHILWAAPAHTPALSKLVLALTKALRKAGFNVEERSFQPHVTLLRHARSPDEMPSLAVPEWPVMEVVLVASTLMPRGPRYQVLGRWPLADSPSSSGPSPGG